jgi:hypothetical protein
LEPNGKKTEKSVRSGPVLVFLRTGPGPVLFLQNGLFLSSADHSERSFFSYFLSFFGTFLMNSRRQGPVGPVRTRTGTGPDQKNSHTPGPGPDRTDLQNGIGPKLWEKSKKAEQRRKERSKKTVSLLPPFIPYKS